MKKILIQFILFIANILIRFYRRLNKDSFNARFWSNVELRKISHFFKGEIINVSAGNDNDKQGNQYQNYFSNKSTYTISNYKKKQAPSNIKEVIIDLEKEIDASLIGKYNVVLTHTVLEHIYDTEIAINNLCKLSKDVIITIVPFLQTYHHEEEFYYDYWRFSPLALINKFKERGLETIYLRWGKDALGDIYILHVASYQPQNWLEIIALNQQELGVEGPGFHRQRLLTRLNMKSERVQINSLRKFFKK